MPGEYFEARERALLGTRYDVLYAAPCAVRRGVTVNGLRCAPQEFAAAVDFGLEPSPFCDAAFLLTDPQLRPGRHAYHHAGVFYVQEPSASVPAGLLGVRPGERVLDLCAAPGGKTSQLAAALRGEGLLVANEYVAARAGVLKSNLERMGVTNALVLNESTARVAAAFPAFFDKVLVDAPCSGEGMFRKEPEALRQHSAALVAQCAALGASILDDAAAALRPGGLLCYSTCTFAPEEDEAQVGAFLARHPEFTVLPAPTNAGAPGEAARCGAHPFAAEHTRRIYPCHGGEGHFMALLQKRGDGAPPEAERARPRAARGQRGAKRGRDMRACRPVQGGNGVSRAEARAEGEAFLCEYFPGAAQLPLECRGTELFVLPREGCGPAEGLRVVQAGVCAGSAARGRFVPAHHLFMAYGAQCANAERLTLADPRTAAWLRGEAIPAETAAPGWAAVLADGFPLGFGKQSGGVVKNHYPKGPAESEVNRPHAPRTRLQEKGEMPENPVARPKILRRCGMCAIIY